MEPDRQPLPTDRAYTETDLVAKADALDCDLIVGDERMLLLDLDNQQALDTYIRNIGMFYEQYSAERTERWTSRHGRTHMVVHLTNPVPDVATRLLLQAALGSDPTRELATWRDHSRGYKTPNVLFKPRVPVPEWVRPTA